MFLSELFNDSFMHHAMSWVVVFVVAADVGVFIIITFLDVPISALFYPFLFYIQVEKIINHTHTHILHAYTTPLFLTCFCSFHLTFLKFILKVLDG